MRESRLYRAQVAGPFLSYNPCKPDLLRDQGSFERVANLVGRGGVSVYYGDILDEELPDAVSSALARSGEGVRTVYLSNALSAYALDKSAAPLDSLRRLLRSADFDSKGLVLLTSLDVGRFFYHSLSFADFEAATDRAHDVGELLDELENRQLIRKRTKCRYASTFSPRSV